MMDPVRKTGEEFYAMLVDENCKGSAAALEWERCLPKSQAESFTTKLSSISRPSMPQERQLRMYQARSRIRRQAKLCSDAIAQPYLIGKMGITVGCSGSRTYMGIEESELTVGIPADLLKVLIEGLRAIIGKAPAK
jgi:uncharacterized protein (DUF169 family)